MATEILWYIVPPAISYGIVLLAFEYPEKWLPYIIDWYEPLDSDIDNEKNV